MEISKTDYKRKWPVVALAHLQYYTKAIKNEPSKWEDMEYDHMHHKFWEGFSTNVGNHAKNKTIVEFNQVNKTASNKTVMIRKV